MSDIYFNGVKLEFTYGASPLLAALPLMRAYEALPPEEKAKAAAEFVRRRLMFDDDE